LVATAGDVPDVSAGLTRSQIRVHEPFKPVEIESGETRHAGTWVKEALIF
jgi:hypothetical protein